MKRTLTITFEFEEIENDGVPYAMDLVNDSVPYALGDDVTFVDAKLDGEVLVDGTGFVSDKVKKHKPQHRAFLKEVMQLQ